jgi:hypothetical protein
MAHNACGVAYTHVNIPPDCGGAASMGLKRVKSDPVSLDTVWTTMTAAKEAGHEGQGAKAHHDSWQ